MSTTFNPILHGVSRYSLRECCKRFKLFPFRTEGDARTDLEVARDELQVRDIHFTTKVKKKTQHYPVKARVIVKTVFAFTTFNTQGGEFPGDAELEFNEQEQLIGSAWKRQQ